MKKVVWEVLGPLNPLRYREFSDRPWWDALECVSKVLLLAVIVLFLVLLPGLFQLTKYFNTQLEKFEALSIRGEMQVTQPVYIPAKKSQVVIDTTGTHSTLGFERFLITEEGLQYRLFNRIRTIHRSEFEALLDNKEKMSMLLTVLTVFLLPSAFFFTYGFLWLKYVLTILFFGTVFYVLFDLTHFRLPWRRMMNVAGYAAAPMILLEVISIPINTDYLVPVVQVVGVNLYLIPLIVYVIFLLIATTMVHVDSRKDHER